MQIAHIALWTTRLEQMRSFYVTYFGGESSEKYVNPGKVSNPISSVSATAPHSKS